MATLTRGPLPARVYWKRRLMVLTTAFLLVFATVRLLSGGPEAPVGRASLAAAPAAASTAPGTGTGEPEQATVAKDRKAKKKQKQKQDEKKAKQDKEPALAEPQGECVDRDVAVTPSVERAVAGRAVLLVLELRTIVSPACTWQVSPETLTVKITSGDDEIWSTRQCAGAVPSREVVVRREVTTKVGVRWTGRRSDAECTRFTDWARPGWYHVAAAALAGEPSDVQFQLTRPQPEVVTRAPEPQQDGKGKDKRKPKPRDKHVAGPGQR